MATLPSSTLQLAKPNVAFPSTPRATTSKPYAPSPQATTPDQEDSTTSTTDNNEEDSFESRLSQVRLRYRSGQGKKAEIRKTRKGKSSGSAQGSESNLFLPPVSLNEPVSEGLNVEFGFSPYSERVNGRIAVIGLTALVLVELATGKGVINYHTPAIVFIQIYFMATVSALYLKYEKEKVSVWPANDNK